MLAVQEYKRITRLGSLAVVIFFAPIFALEAFAKLFSISPDMSIWLAIFILFLVMILQGLFQWWISCFSFLRIIKINQQRKTKNA